MRYRKLSPTGDYTFGNGQSDFWRDVPDAVAQAVKTGLLLWLGEWFLDIEEGTLFMQGILGKYSKEDADQVIQNRVRDIQGVENIESYDSTLDPDTRGMNATFTINTAYGPTEVQIANYGSY